MNVLSQFRERRIVQIVLSYLAAGWALLQVVDQLTQRSILPNVTYTVALVWFAIGLMAAILVGWNHGERGKQRAHRGELFTLLLLALVAMGGSGFAVRQDVVQARSRAAAEHPLDQRNVAVMYFRDDTNDPQLSYVADGLTEDLIQALGGVNELNVLSRNATAPFRDTDATLDSVAKQLDVGTIVDGSVEKRGSRIAVSLQLVDGRSGTVIERAKIELPAQELLAVRDSVVDHAAILLRQWIGQEVRVRASEAGTSVREAWALVQRAEKLRKQAEAAVRSNGNVAGENTFTNADLLLQQAQTLDVSWPEPAVERAQIAYRRARLAAAAGSLEKAVTLIGSGLEHAADALTIARNEPRALEMRGTLKYFKWLLNVTPSAQERADLLRDARKDLETAVALKPALASAHSTLSHLLYNDDLSSAVLEAKRAYEEDAYLEVAPEIVWRLFYGNFDLENFTQAKEWCQKGQQRFADDYRFTFCELRLMASPATPPDVERAWQLLARIDSLAPAPRKPFERVRGEIFVAGVVARAALRDSAQAILARAEAKVNPDIDPSYDLFAYEATVRLLLGQKDAAFNLLRRVVLANPDQALKPGKPLEWVYRDLQDYPRLHELYARNSD
ncbi:MAG TPA: hypothetical protein VF021_03135 [Longimicrobiales bacterium]